MDKDVQARILIAGGPELVRRGIRDVLNRDRRFGAVGEVERVAELPEATLDTSPDLVVLDLGSASDGASREHEALQALQETVRLSPGIHAIVVTESEGIDGVLRAVRAGAHGVLLCDAPARSLIEAAGEVLAGACVLDPRLTRRLFEHWQEASQGLAANNGAGPLLAPAILGMLSPREREVLRALAQGHRNKEIAVELGVSVGTVKTHLRHIYRKLTVADRTAAVVSALHVQLADAA